MACSELRRRAGSGIASHAAVRASDCSILGTYSAGADPFGLAFDGTYIWAANSGANTVTKLRAADGTTIAHFNVPTTPLTPAFDGNNIWVASLSGSVSKM